MRIPIFDNHIHMDSRSADDYELMAISGVEKILVPCTFTGQKKSSPDAFRYYFDRLIGFERNRASKFGISLYAALAVHPGDIKDYRIAFEALDALRDYLQHDSVKAIGEISLKTFSDRELDLFVRQVLIAKEHNLPVIIEAPARQEDIHADRTAEILEAVICEHHLNRNALLMVDLNIDKLQRYWPLNLGGYGIPVSPKLNGLFVIHEKLDPNEAMQVIEKYGTNKIMFNSALHFGYGDPIAISRTLLHLAIKGVPEAELKKLAFDNSMTFFKVGE